MNIGNRFLAAAALLGLAACGGGGGSDGGGMPATLSVSSTAPASGATGVSRKGDIVLTFSAALDTTSIGINTISVTTPTGSEPFTALTVGNTIRITPFPVLRPLLRHQVTVGTGLRGARGETLAAPFTMTFTTADRQWQTPTRLEPMGSTTAERPRVVADTRGNVIAVWQRRDGDTRSIWASRYTAGTGWNAAVQISTVQSATSNADAADIDVDAFGNAIAVWEQLDNGLFRVWSSRYAAGATWSPPVQIQTITNATGSALMPHLAMDGVGNALAVWAQSEGGVYGIWSNRYAAGGSWGTAVQAEMNPGDADSAQVAFDSGGRAFAVWNQGAGTCACIWSNQYTVTDGWGTPKMIASDTAVRAFVPNISVDGLGNAYAVWTQSDDGSQFDIWSNRFTAGGAGWGTPVMIDDHLGGAGSPKIVADLSGNAYAVWEQSLSNAAGVGIRSNRYDASTGWGAPVLVSSATDTQDATGGNPDIAFDPNGIAFAVWEHGDAVRTRVRSSRLMPPPNGWTPSLDVSDAGGVAEPVIAVDPFGDATAVWEQTDGTGVSVWSSRYE